MKTASSPWSSVQSLDWLYRLINDPCENADLDRDLQDKVRAQQVRIVSRMTPSVMFGKAACALALALALYQSAQLSPWAAVWCAFATIVAAQGGAAWYIAQKRASPSSISRRHRTRLVKRSLFMAVVWSFPPLFLLPASDGAAHSFIVVMSAGMVAAGAAALYAMPAAAFVYCSVVSTATLTGILLAGSDAFFGYLIMALAFLFIISRSIVRHSQTFVAEFVARVQSDQRNGRIERMLESAETAAVAERQRAELRLAQAQKMESIGQLTGGIAHDFNNLLAAIQGNAELLELEGKSDRTLTQPILQATERGSDLVHRLLSFARKQTLRPKRLAPGGLVQQTQALLRRTLGEDIRIETEIETGLWDVHVDPGQVEAALVNLALNARDALPSGGRLVMRCANIRADDSAYLTDLGITAGDFVAIAVSDNGRGMTPRTRDRAIDPFFTTKGAGEGSGLGLSTVYGFVRQSGGHLCINSELGSGTTVTVFLPRLIQSEHGVGQAAPDREMPLGEGQRILVVEDDAAVQRTVCDMLISLNYQVVRAENADQARQILQCRSDLHLVLSDVVLPGPASGLQLSQIAEHIRPGLPVLLMSGFSVTSTAEHQGPIAPMLKKPFDRRQLADFVAGGLVPAC